MEEGCAGAIDGSKHRWRTERRNFEVQMQSHIQYVALVEVIEDRRWFTQIVLKVTKMESAKKYPVRINSMPFQHTYWETNPKISSNS